MSRISILGHGGQLVAAAIILGAAIASPVSAQSSVTEQTCRPALGQSFSVTSGIPDRRCCLVLEEADWYRANDVTGGRVYLRADALKVRPKGCSAAELAALGTGAGPGGDDVPKKRKPYEQPLSLLYGSGGDPPAPKPLRDIYY